MLKILKPIRIWAIGKVIEIIHQLTFQIEINQEDLSIKIKLIPDNHKKEELIHYD